MTDHSCFDNAADDKCTVCGSTIITKPGQRLGDIVARNSVSEPRNDSGGGPTTSTPHGTILHAHQTPRIRLFLVTLAPFLARWLLPDYVFLSWWRRWLIRRSLRWQMSGFVKWARWSWRLARVGADDELERALCGYAGRMLVMGG